MNENELKNELAILTNDKEKNNIILHKDTALQKLNSLLSNYIDDPSTMSKSDKLSYWIEDFCRLIEFEDEFQPSYLKKYERGDVIKVNLGYNIGNEEGGLHYCVVLDKSNSQYSGIITVIPLTSDKGKKPHFSEVNLGNEIFVNFRQKIYDPQKTGDILSGLRISDNSLDLINSKMKQLFIK